MTDIEAIAFLNLLRRAMVEAKTDKSAIEAVDVALGAIHDRVVLEMTTSIREIVHNADQ